ncbi:hypothetical protein [Streptomyces sp. MH60]|uniref:hypothetical protein n=1 Tax=Streptomyces sp. MH60 TaxID=1940758 RepID=UPI001F54060A|nr:hypothetical protein [Streptomyces sp. MH60]
MPKKVADGTCLKNAYAAEVAHRIPTKPISALSTDYPNAGIDTSAFGSGVTASALSTYGAPYGGGAYPYCNQMVLPSYSLAKTMFTPHRALMRLTQVHGSSVPSQLIRDRVSTRRTPPPGAASRFRTPRTRPPELLLQRLRVRRVRQRHLPLDPQPGAGPAAPVR